MSAHGLCAVPIGIVADQSAASDVESSGLDVTCSRHSLMQRVTGAVCPPLTGVEPSLGTGRRCAEPVGMLGDSKVAATGHELRTGQASLADTVMAAIALGRTLGPSNSPQSRRTPNEDAPRAPQGDPLRADGANPNPCVISRPRAVDGTGGFHWASLRRRTSIVTVTDQAPRRHCVLANHPQRTIEFSVRGPDTG